MNLRGHAKHKRGGEMALLLFWGLSRLGRMRMLVCSSTQQQLLSIPSQPEIVSFNSFPRRGRAPVRVSLAKDKHLTLVRHLPDEMDLKTDQM